MGIKSVKELFANHIHELLALEDEDLGLEVLNSVFVDKGFESITDNPEAMDLLKQLIYREIRVNNPDDLFLRETLQLAARGELSEAGRIFRHHMEKGALLVAALDEATTGRRRQKLNARRPRPRKPNPLNSLLEALVSKQPKISEKEALTRIEKSDEVLDFDVNADNGKGRITFHDGQEFPIVGMKDRLSRAKKKFSNN